MRGNNTKFNIQFAQETKMEINHNGQVRFPILFPSRAIINNGSGHLESSIITDTELAYLVSTSTRIVVLGLVVIRVIRFMIAS